jgi:hypothetical protein
MDQYSREELEEALKIVSSAISRCEKAQLKYAVGTSHHTRFRNMIKAMTVSKALIMDEIGESVRNTIIEWGGI